jgi:LCP family protein required for cell wall assembly
LTWIIFVLFVAGGLLFGYVAYSTLIERLAQPLNPVAGDTSGSLGSLLPGGATGKNSQGISPSQPWSGRERVTILVMGIDQRETERGQPSRTDTMILLTLDPVNKTAGMLSIPRDLWVPMPSGLGRDITDRINTANLYGDLYKYPGGGAVFAKRAVEYNLGVRVHRYVLLDFKGFERIVDVLGGVTINVDKEIYDDQYPDETYGVRTVHIPAGMQHMDGATALIYVRERHVDSDFGRIRRQQKFLLALRDQALRINVLPRVPQLITLFKDAVKTDLSAQEIIQLAQLAAQVDSKDIQVRAIDETMVQPYVTAQGADVLIPQRDKIAKLIGEMFAEPQAGGPEVVVPTAVSRSPTQAALEAEKARIELLNGTPMKGLAARARTYLQGLGFTIVTIGDASRSDYRDTVIVIYNEKKATVEELVRLFAIKPANVRQGASSRSDVDLRVIIGSSARIP